MAKLKVKGKEYELKDITLDLRCDILDSAMKVSNNPEFSVFVGILRKATNLKDEQIMAMSTEEISQVNLKIVELCNSGKKSTKSR